MLNKNKKIRDYINLTSYHDAGYTGKGVKVCILEGKTEHNEKANKCLRESTPDSEVIGVDSSYSNEEQRAAIFKNVLASGANILTMSLNDTGMNEEEVQALVDSGITLLMSAGNKGKRGMSYITKDTHWLAVGALNMPFDVPVLEDYSSRGEDLDTVSFIPWIDHGYVQSPDGTSFSCPFFAGVLACYFQYFKERFGRFPTQPEVVTLIKEHSKDLDIAGFDIKTAYGILILPEIQEVQRMETRTATNRIVIHHSASSANTTVEQIDQWHKNQGFEKIGYHFFIEMDGTVKEGRQIWSVGAHAIGANNDSVGICLAGNFEEQPPASFQMQALAEQIKYIRTLYGNIPYQGHSEVDPVNHPTACPGALFPWDDLKQRLEVAPVAEDWKEAIMNRAREVGLIDKDAEHNADDPAQKWFVLDVILDALKLKEV